MKKLIVIIVVLIMVELGSTYYISRTSENHFKEIQAILNENPFITSEVVSYQSGFFKSQAETRLKFKFNPNHEGIRVKHTIFHGPIILGVGFPIHFQYFMIKSISDESTPSATFPFEAHTRMNFRGNIESTYTGKPFELTDYQTLKMVGGEWFSHIKISDHGSKFIGKTTVSDIALQRQDKNIQVKDLIFQLNESRSHFGQWLGNVSLSIGKIMSPEKELMFDNVKFAEESTLKGEIVNLSWRLDLEKMTLNKNTYGPGHLKVQLLNLDPEFLVWFSRHKETSAENNNAEILKKFLTKKPGIVIDDATLKVPSGDVKLTISAFMGDQTITLPLTKEQILKTIEGEVYLIIPKTILEKVLSLNFSEQLQKKIEYQKITPEQQQLILKQHVDASIQNLLKEGVLKEQQNNYEIKITVKQGEVVKNNN